MLHFGAENGPWWIQQRVSKKNKTDGLYQRCTRGSQNKAGDELCPGSRGELSFLFLNVGGGRLL